MARTRIATTVLLALLVVTAAAPGGGLAAIDGGDEPAAVGATHGCSFPFTSVDATGTEVAVSEEPETVVTLNPSAAQTMWEIGAKDKVVGVTKHAMFLDGAEEKTNISGSGYTTVVTEKVVGLEPDLVLVPNATNNFKPEKVQQLRDAGLTVYVFSFATSLDDISEKTELTGQLVGECVGAEQSAAEMESKLDTIRTAVEGEERPEVLFVLGPGGYTAGSGTFIDTAIDTAGGTNIATDENITGYKPISEEIVAERDPDWIVKPASVSLPPSDVYNESTAVQEGRVLEVNQNHISQPAPRIVDAILEMVKAFHPEAYAEAAATDTPTERTETTTPMDTATPEPTETTNPGFGPVVAVLGLLGAGLLARRD